MDAIPPELLREVFQFSTLPHYLEDRSSRTPEQQKTKWSLVLVCKKWRALATEILYQDVLIDDCAQDLLDVLKRSARDYETSGYGRWVRRITLHSEKLVFPVQFMDILRYCPQLEVLVKPGYDVTSDLGLNGDSHFWQDILHIRHGSSPPPLSSLRKISWVGTSSPMIEYVHYEELDRLRLSEIILHSPNLRALTLGIRNGDLFSRLTCRQPNTILFPSLEKIALVMPSLRFTRMGIGLADMPKLAHLAIYPHSSSAHTMEIVLFLKTQLQTVEVLPVFGAVKFPIIPDILRACPNVRQLIYYNDNVTLDARKLTPHSSLTCVRLCHDPDRWTIRPPGRTAVELYESTWASLRSHFAVFAGPMFPALERVVLQGEWTWMVSNLRFHSLHASLHERGCRLEYTDGTPV